MARTLKDLSNNLKYIQEVKGLTNIEVAKRAGMAPATIVGYRKQNALRGFPKDESFARLAKALNVSVQDLIGDKLPVHIEKSYGMTPEIFKQISDQQHGRIESVDGTNPNKPIPKMEKETEEEFVISDLIRIISENRDNPEFAKLFELLGRRLYAKHCVKEG